jgi:hypothetical protein
MADVFRGWSQYGAQFHYLSTVSGGGYIGSWLSAWLARADFRTVWSALVGRPAGADTEPAASPDGRLIAFTSWRDGVPRIWIKQLAGGGEAPITAGPDGVARFSPDGSNLIFVHDVGKKQVVYRIGLVGGDPRPVLDDASAADWSPDGRRILFVRSGSSGSPHARIGVLDRSRRERIVADEETASFTPRAGLRTAAASRGLPEALPGRTGRSGQSTLPAGAPKTSAGSRPAFRSAASAGRAPEESSSSYSRRSWWETTRDPEAGSSAAIRLPIGGRRSSGATVSCGRILPFRSH